MVSSSIMVVCLGCGIGVYGRDKVRLSMHYEIYGYNGEENFDVRRWIILYRNVSEPSFACRPILASKNNHVSSLPCLSTYM
jgi:hypothetical protein